jgi:photosystem II stability/assembly factor-like uncharacterized protein
VRRWLACSLAFAFLTGAAPARIDPSYFANLHWRMIGPFRGGRALAVAGVPGQPDHFYFGAVDGGVWESTDAGRTWNPIFDGENIGSIGAIAVAASDPRTLYVGSGEADMRSDIAYGNGMYKSIDGGKSWAHIGLEDTRQIGAVLIDPRDANVVYVAALGHQYGPNAQRGVFKTIDGGKTWSKVLFKNDDTGAIALAMDPAHPDAIYAALWQTRRPPWNVYPPSNGPGSGLYKSTDAGKTWTQLAGGLPAHVGRIGVSVSPADPQRVYATIDSEAKSGGIYRSDDAGATWTHTDGDARIWQRGWYFGGITADTKNRDVVYVMDTATYRSIDGGKSFVAIRGAPGGDDYHTLWIDPGDAARMILGSDQGVVVSVNDAKTWSSWYNQPTAQFYHVITDARFPYWAYGAQQDSGAAAAPSATKYATISNQDFHPIDVGGENGFIAPDPRHPGLIFGGVVTKELIDIGWEQNVDPSLNYPGTDWRSTWTLPLAFSPADKTSLYFGHQKVFRSRDGGSTWAIVSPDLSRVNEGTPANLDATTLADDNGLQRHGVVYAISPSPLDARTVWAGTDDGSIWITRDGASRWSNVTPPALSAWSKVGIIESSHFDPAGAYAAIDRHRLEDYSAHIYRTHDFGATWTAIAKGIPDGSFVNVVREDPKRRGLLYAGTERGVYVSFDDGDDWMALQLNLPVSSVRDIAIRDNDLVIATHGRSFWALDDIASLRDMPAAAAGGGAYFFAPANAVRTRPGNEEGTPLPLDEPQTDNPPTGAIFEYYLPDVARTPVVLSVFAADGTRLRRWSSADKPDVTDPASVDIAPQWLTTPPLPATTAGSHRFVWGFTRDSDSGPLVPPGTYTVRLAVNGQTYARTVVIQRDPRVPANDADLRAQYALAMQITASITAVDAARERAKSMEKRASATSLKMLRQIAGGTELGSPDNSGVGSPANDFTSLKYLDGALNYLLSAVESADAAPTADMQSAYRKLEAISRQTLARLHAMEKIQ